MEQVQQLGTVLKLRGSKEIIDSYREVWFKRLERGRSHSGSSFWTETYRNRTETNTTPTGKMVLDFFKTFTLEPMNYI